MKKITIIFLLGLSLFLFQSCEEKLPIKLGENYFLRSDGSWGHAIITDARGVFLIDPQIVAWNYDSIFIIAKQKPFDEIYDTIQAVRLYDRDKIYEECQIFNYWIIDKRKELDSYYDERNRRRRYIGAVIGPLTYEEYWAKREELNVPDSLKLKEAERVKFRTLFYYRFNWL
jgi:hypothetical protein